MAYKLLMTVCVVGGLMLCNQAIGANARPADSKAPVINACALLSSAEISQAIGFPVDNGRRKDAGFQSDGSYSSACVWVIQQAKAVTPNPSAPLGGRSFVILNAMQWPAGSGLARTFLQAFHEAATSGVIPATPFGQTWNSGLPGHKAGLQ